MDNTHETLSPLTNPSRTMSAKTVTAQDFIDALHGANCVFGVGWDSALKDIDALLSQARQEARREAVEECQRKVKEFPIEGMKKEIDAIVAKERQEARREALKEMDEAYLKAMILKEPNTVPLQTLRREAYGK